MGEKSANNFTAKLSEIYHLSNLTSIVKSIRK